MPTVITEIESRNDLLPLLEQNPGIIVIKLGAEWCGPCKLIEKEVHDFFENAPSNLASIGRYVLTPDIFDILRSQPIGVEGEIQLADSINAQAIDNRVEAVLLNGMRFDCGSIEGYIDAIRHASSSLKI